MSTYCTFYSITTYCLLDLNCLSLTSTYTYCITFWVDWLNPNKQVKFFKFSTSQLTQSVLGRLTVGNWVRLSFFAELDRLLAQETSDWSNVKWISQPAANSQSFWISYNFPPKEIATQYILSNFLKNNTTRLYFSGISTKGANAYFNSLMNWPGL